MKKITNEEKACINECVDILTNDGFFNKPIAKGKHWRVALVLNDVHFGCCLFTDEESMNEFLNNYRELVKITGKKWGCAIAEFVESEEKK